MKFNQSATSSWPTNENLELSCPEGGEFYACATSWIQFLGCCTIDPCASGDGCPDANLRTASYNKQAQIKFPPQACESDSSEVQWWTCGTFAGCCSTNPCAEGDGCPRSNLSQAKLSTDSSRLPGLLSSINVTDNPLIMWQADRAHTGFLGYGPILGLCLALILAVTLASLFLVLKAFPHRLPPSIRRSWLCKKVLPEQYRLMSEHGVSRVWTGESRKHSVQGAQDADGAETTLLDKPRVVQRRDFAWKFELVWNLVLTLLPFLFIVLAMLALCLENEDSSSYGDSVVEVIRISPTVYPIVFAAVAARFYRNISRWSLERPLGIKLATLEQLSGSQSFAGAVERLLFVRTHITIGTLTLLTWVLSPIGGQSASRILYRGVGQLTESGTVFYADPARQFSYFFVSAMVAALKTNVYSVYTVMLMATFKQRHSARDLWNLPRIPQWPVALGSAEAHNVDIETMEQGLGDYASLLGIKIYGLFNGRDESRSEFTVETSYFDLECSNVDVLDETDLAHWSSDNPQLGQEGRTGVIQEMIDDLHLRYRASFTSRISAAPLTRRNMTTKDTSYHLIWASVASKNDEGKHIPSDMSIYNCTIGSRTLQTEIRCDSASTCSAWRQRLLKSPEGRDDPLRALHDNFAAFQNGTQVWPEASGDNHYGNTGTATEAFLRKADSLYGTKERDYVDWNVTDFSRRLTTMFNTFWDATRHPMGYASVDVRSQPPWGIVAESPYDIPEFLTSTEVVARGNNVYLVDRVWLGILLTATVVLQVLAINGALLLLFIKGPDILGFASTMTRDNIHVPLPPSGSALDGPERARALRDLRIHLADLRPADDKGYIGIASVSCLKETDKPTRQDNNSTEDTAYEGRSDEISLRSEGSPDASRTEEASETGSTYRRLNKSRLYI